MEELTLRQMQEGALNILKKLDGICREQGLRYFLFYGTLIGAIRHKGFIPW
ncbi:MAG TPA: LicD family protein, partial [Oscillibacter sp.]|nr:LicD family protein [Oscillibacter sp.]